MQTTMDPTASQADSLALPSPFLRELFDAAHLGIVVLSAAGKVLDSNQSFQSQLLYGARELQQLSVLDIIDPADRAAVASALAALVEQGRTQASFEQRFVRSDGSAFVGRADARVIDADAPAQLRVVLLLQDVTVEHESRRTRQELERRLNDWMTRAPIAIVRADLSAGAEALSAARRQGIQDFDIVMRDQLAIDQALRRYVRVTFVNRTLVDILDANDTEELLGRYQEVFVPATIDTIVALLRCMWDGVPTWQGIVPHRTLKGRMVQIRFSASVDRDSAADVMLCGMDVTDLVTSEKTKLKLDSQLEQLQKLESLGVLAGGIAHDFNNLFQAISGNAELLKMDLPQSSEAEISLDNILDATATAGALCEQMLAYAGRASADKSWQNVNGIITAMKSLLDTSVKGRELRLQLQPNLPHAHVDESQIRQLLLNLVTNAAESFSRPSGQVSLRTYARAFLASELRNTVLGKDPQPGVYVVIEVNDDGDGMNEETMARIFDPFFTTKFTGRGLGLATVLGIVRGHGGTMAVTSALTAGTCIRVLLPTAHHRVGEERSGAAQLPVLVVDDNSLVLAAIARMIERAGYPTITAECGQEALGHLRRQPSISLVVLDVTMPNMSGIETLEQIRSFSDVPVVLVSGYSVESLQADQRPPTYQAFLRKPFSRDKLIETLHSFLGMPDLTAATTS